MLFLSTIGITNAQDYEALGHKNFREGQFYLESGDYDKAVSYFEKAYELYIKNNNIKSTAKTVNKIGDCYFGMGKYETAFVKKLKALEIFSLLKETNNIKSLLLGLSRKCEFLIEESSLSQAIKDYMYEKFKSVRNVVEFFPELYAITTLSNLYAYNLTLIGYDEIALEIYQKAIYINSKWKYSKEDETYKRAVIQNVMSCILNSGAVYEKNRDYRRALGHYQEVIDFAFVFDIYNVILPALDGIYTIYKDVGNDKSADKYYEYVIKGLTKEKADYTSSEVRYFFANKLKSLEKASYERSEELYEEALSNLGIAGKADYKELSNKDRKELAMKIIIDYSELKIANEEYEDALSLLEKAVKVFELFQLDKETYPIYHIVKKIYLNQAKAKAGLAQLEDAKKDYIKAIAVCQKDGDMYSLADYFIQMAVFEKDYRKNTSSALYLYNRALEYNKQGLNPSEDNNRMLSTHYNSQNLLYEQKRRILKAKADIFYHNEDYDKALMEIEKIRLMLMSEGQFTLKNKSEQIRETLSSYKMVSYIFKKLSEGEKSFNFTEYARLWVFYENLYRNNILSGFKSSDSETSSTRNLSKLLLSLAETLEDSKDKQDINRNSLAVSYAYGKIPGKDGKQTNLNYYYKLYAQTVDKLKSTNPNIEDLFSKNITTAGEIKKEKFIPKDTIILAYSLNYTDSAKPLLFLIADNKVKYYIDLKNNDYSSLVKEYLDSLQNPENDDYKSNSEQLYKYLIEPTEKVLKDYESILIIPDGALNYLPFETLINNEGKFLIENYNIHYSTSMTTYRDLAVKTKKQKNRALIKNPLYIIGGNVYDETEKMSENSNAIMNEYMNNYTSQLSITLGTSGIDNLLERLNLSDIPKKDISDNIGQLAEIFYSEGTSEYISAVHNGEYGTEADLLEADTYKRLRNYLILHISTQVLNIEPFTTVMMFPDRKYNRSYEDGYFRFNDIYSLKLDNDLVIMDNMLTIFGDELTGESISNTINAFIRSGSNGVLAGLWQTDTASNTVFIKEFYKKVDELRSQRELISYSNLIRDIKLNYLNSEKHHHPYYWSHLVLYSSK